MFDGLDVLTVLPEYGLTIIFMVYTGYLFREFKNYVKADRETREKLMANGLSSVNNLADRIGHLSLKVEKLLERME
jgi:hypothetical protein